MRLPFTIRDRDTQGNFDWLIRRLIDTGGRSLSLRVGADSWTFPGGARSSNVKTVTHGLGKEPIAAFVMSTNRFLVYEANNLTATTFDTRSMEVDGALVAAGDIAFYWLAIG